MSLFGTDGIRGLVGFYPIDPKTFLHLGWALAQIAKQGRVIVAKDTRLSCYMLESALVSGLTAAGADVFLTGPLPTPALAVLTQQIQAEIGVMISASHNPYTDNGIKLFDAYGHKFNDSQQKIVEEYLKIPFSLNISPGKVYRIDDAIARYHAHLEKKMLFREHKNISLTLDLANGAAYKIAPLFFEQRGMALHVLHACPNGFNINENCGVVHPESLESVLLQCRTDFAIAFDGDADRFALYIAGEKCDPHYILLMLYDLYKRRFNYSGGIVGTQLHNGAIESFCKKHHIDWKKTQVGDRFLLEKCLESDYLIAGEPSGHYLLADKSPSSDALLIAALLIDDLISEEGKNLDWYKKNVPLWPSSSRSLAVSSPKEFMQQRDVYQEIQALPLLYPHLRIFIRPSGTEPVLRVYIEGEQKHQEYALIHQQLLERIECFEQSLQERDYGKNCYSQLEASMGKRVG